ncbi:MAG: hypothetical protein LBK25_08635 [Treponema sp.]|nr:hypothetical protein [Treponema sp.]
MRVGGWRKTAFRRAVDRGAHHKGVCVPITFRERRAPLLNLLIVVNRRLRGVSRPAFA